MADNSKDVFEPEERPAPDSIAELSRTLKVAVAEVGIGRRGGPAA